MNVMIINYDFKFSWSFNNFNLQNVHYRTRCFPCYSSCFFPILHVPWLSHTLLVLQYPLDMDISIMSRPLTAATINIYITLDDQGYTQGKENHFSGLTLRQAVTMMYSLAGPRAQKNMTEVMAMKKLQLMYSPRLNSLPRYLGHFNIWWL